MSLIDEFKTEHEQLINHFKQCIAKLDEPQSCKTSLNNIKSLLASHIKKEDHEIYKKLETIAQKNDEVRYILDTFTSDLKVLNDRIFMFIANMSDDTRPEFFSDYFQDLASLVDRRLDREETILFKLYEEHCGKLLKAS